MRSIILACAIFLSACGSGGNDSPQWHGGLFLTWQVTGDNQQWVCRRDPSDQTPCGIMILHQGHDCFDGCRYDDSLVPRAQEFAAAGLTVYGYEMPPEPHDSGPIERYYQPVLDLLGTLEGSGQPVYMSGLSGGGWTTTVVTAIDSRITKGWAVDGDPANEDWEQKNTPFDYYTLYNMGGERLVHVYIPGESPPSTCATLLALQHPCIEDPVSRTHNFSKWTADRIVEDIRRTTH